MRAPSMSNSRRVSASKRYLELPANATDLLVRASIVVQTPRDGFTIVSAPERPDYWFANCLIVEREPEVESYAHWIACHATAFAGRPVQRRVVVWELDERKERPSYDGPMERERSTVFRVRRLPLRKAPIARIREFDEASQWDAAAAIERDALIADGLAERVAFGAWRFSVYRADAAGGRCRVWGAFVDDRLVAYAGIYASERYARFITPVTERAFRRQGLFAALCSVAVAETSRAHPHASIIIVAATGDAPERIYERLGFEAIGEQHALIAPATAG